PIAFSLQISPVSVIISMRKALSLFYLSTEIITFPLKGRLSSFIVSGKFPYRVKFYTKARGMCCPMIACESFPLSEE
ncbi:MAG: hypothetical protein SO089_01105, partial [Dialister sp.]|nr:hypothetical protein [Dialister sp.]